MRDIEINSVKSIKAATSDVRRPIIMVSRGDGGSHEYLLRFVHNVDPDNLLLIRGDDSAFLWARYSPIALAVIDKNSLIDPFIWSIDSGRDFIDAIIKDLQCELKI